MSRRSRSVLVFVLAALWAANGLGVWSQDEQKVPPKNISTLARGKGLFSSSCAQCHGLDGKGSERAPNIADRPAVRRLSDAQISGIVQNGVPGTGMPAFHSLASPQVKAVVGYLRALQGKHKTAALPGNPQRGRAIFFGKAGCSECHMIAGQGGFIASDLSGYAHIHAVDEVRQAIIAPARSANADVATVTLKSGRSYSGRIRNEDNFSLQLETMDGEFYFFSKLDLDKVQHDSRPFMPLDYGTRLEPNELNDLLSYLMTATKGDEPIDAQQDEWEQ